MTSLILELQSDALNRDVPVTDLLRKAMVVARKLNINEFEEWIKYELEGYPNDKSEIPEYRNIHGYVKAWNPYQGWLPIMFGDSKIEKLVSNRKSRQSIAEIESLILDAKDSSKHFQMPFTQEHHRILCDYIQEETQITLMTPKTSLVKILDTARNIVLNWALKLEEDGLLGEGMTFSNTEKQEADKHSYNVNNFYAAVTGTQIQQGATNSHQEVEIENLSYNDVGTFLTELKTQLPNLDIDDANKRELQADIQSIEGQLSSPQPKEGVLKECLGSIRRILEGAGGGAAAQLLMQIGSLF